MSDLFRSFWRAVRRWPLYTGLAALGVLVLLGSGLRGTRLLGDDSESSDTELSGPPRSGGHGGYVNGFNHK